MRMGHDRQDRLRRQDRKNYKRFTINILCVFFYLILPPKAILPIVFIFFSGTHLCDDPDLLLFFLVRVR